MHLKKLFNIVRFRFFFFHPSGCLLFQIGYGLIIVPFRACHQLWSGMSIHREDYNSIHVHLFDAANARRKSTPHSTVLLVELRLSGVKCENRAVHLRAARSAVKMSRMCQGMSG